MEDPKYKQPLNRFDGIEPGQLPIGADGAIMPGPVGAPPPLPPVDTFKCLQGPCRYYWHFESAFPAGNPAGTFGPDGALRDVDGKPVPEPRSINRSCLVHPGTETDLTGDHVHRCNLWDPLTPKLTKIRDKRRDAYYKQNPQHKEKT